MHLPVLPVAADVADHPVVGEVSHERPLGTAGIVGVERDVMTLEVKEGGVPVDLDPILERRHVGEAVDDRAGQDGMADLLFPVGDGVFQEGEDGLAGVGGVMVVVEEVGGAGQGEGGAGLAQRVIALDGQVEGGLQAVLEAAKMKGGAHAKL